MPSARLAILCFLFAATAACAQPPQTGSSVGGRVSTHARRVPQPRHETYEITIAFKRTVHGESRTDKTYTLLATVGELLPAIRDDTRYRTDASCTDPACAIEGATDVDILRLRPQGDSICIALKISMQTLNDEPPDYLPKLPVTTTHQYLVTPTVPIGKRITVYSAFDARYNNSVEVQLLINPFDLNKSEQQP